MHVNRRLLASSAVLSVITLALLVVSGLAVASIKDYTFKIADEQRKIDRQYALRRTMRSSAIKLSDSKMRIGGLAATAIHEGDELDFITALEKTALEADVEQDIQLETVNQKETSKWEKEIPLTLTVTGPYPRILMHLNAIERLPYAINVQQVAVDSVGATANAAGTVRVTISAKVYWQGDNAPDFVSGRDETQALLGPQ